MSLHTEILLLELQLQDIEECFQTHKGKHTERNAPDFVVALRRQAAELQRALTSFLDQRMSQSISDAVQDDGAILSILRAEENRASRDRRLAMRLAGLAVEDEDTPRNHLNDDSLLARFASLNICRGQEADRLHDESFLGGDDFNGGEGSSTRIQRSAQKTHECVSCMTHKSTFDIIETRCEHQYCRDCISKLFQNSILDESLFPAKCCGIEIPFSVARKLLDPNLMQQVEKKAIEYGTADRTYCAELLCSTFISPDLLDGDEVICPVCSERTCSLCKQLAHSGRECYSDTGLEPMLRAAEKAGWRQCIDAVIWLN